MKPCEFLSLGYYKLIIKEPMSLPLFLVSLLLPALAQTLGQPSGQASAPAAGQVAVVPPASAEAVLEELKAGNKRFVDGRRTRSLLSSEDPKLRETLARGQNPCAVIIACSDSRVGDNFIFDQELGRLFTIRQAGNSPDLQAIASAEYAVEYLGCQVVMVLAHTSCGAVKAVADAKGTPLPGNLWAFQAAMAGLLEATPRQPKEEHLSYYRRLERVNAMRQAKALVHRSELLRAKVASGKLKVVPAVYDLVSGKVIFLEEAQAEPELAQAH